LIALCMGTIQAVIKRECYHSYLFSVVTNE
jgi:hypothetical protein